MTARFITFEGGEGVGKSTQIRRLAKHLKTAAIDVVVTREPGGTPGAEALRHVLLSGAAESLGPAAELILFSAARIDHVDRLIRPALARGAWVLCDRFIDSTRVYQADGADPGTVIAFERVATGGLEPDLTIILDAPPEVGLKRALKRARSRRQDGLDRFEQAALAEHQRRRQAFLDLAEAEPERCVVVDATTSQKKTAEAVLEAVELRLGPLLKDDAESETATYASIDSALDAIRGPK